MLKIEIIEYIDRNGNSPFGKWFTKLSGDYAAKVVTATLRLERGNFGDVKSVGSGVSEIRMTYGKGIRIYFAKDGETLVILLGGGTKTRQAKDIEHAKQCWLDYKQRKTE